MTVKDKIEYYQKNFNLVDTFFLSGWTPGDWTRNWQNFENQLSTVRKESFENNERIIFVFDTNDYDTLTFKNFFKKFIYTLYKIDIGNFFVVVLTNNNSELLSNYFKQYSQDSVEPTIEQYDSTTVQNNTSADTFCILPWNHLMVMPYHAIKTCCIAADNLGYADQVELKEVWNNEQMVEIRQSLLNNSYHPNCTKCYEIEKNNKISSRQKHNIKFAEQVIQVKRDKTVVLDKFEMKYFDLRFTNLCNIRCRTCNHHSSSKWYQDTVKLDPTYDKPALMKAGRTELDMWEQLVPHFDSVESIYFAGGEPLIMDEHYMILDELERRGLFNVHLIYNTNFTQTKLKDREVFDYWRRFKSVSVAASLDAMGPRAEYIRRDTNWDIIERNRAMMMEICPRVDFYVSSTLGILNAWHLPDFHRTWVERGFIRAQDLDVNILQHPAHYRIDIASPEFKQSICSKYKEHLEWLRPNDPLQRATLGFEGAINFMMAADNSQLLPEFWDQTYKLDAIRNENLLDVLPELTAIVGN